MSGTPDDDHGEFTRRTFLQASSAAAGAGILGAGAVGGAAADSSLDTDFANARVQEASKAWDRGFRGRADRSLALTDTGIEGRHPDLGPWNGVTATVNTETDTLEFLQGDVGDLTTAVRYDGVARHEENYTAATGTLLRLFVHGPFSIPVEEFDTTDDDDVRIHAVITWEPHNPEGGEPADFDMRLVKNGQQIGATGASLTDLPEDNRKDLYVNEDVVLDSSDNYEIWVYGYGAPGAYEVDVDVDEIVDRSEENVVLEEPVYPYDAESVTLQEVRDLYLPEAGDAPEVVGWNNDVPRYGSYNRPLDSNGHGSHCSSIMAGSGEASAVDVDRYGEDEPATVLVAGQTLEYEVDAAADTGVFASGYGEDYEIVIEGPDGDQLARSTTLSGTVTQESFLNNMAVTETVHESGEATYTVRYRANHDGPEPARVERVGYGAFLHHSGTVGDALDPAASADADETVHAGVCPGNSLVGITGLGGAAETLATDPESFASAFGVRAVNMSWGYVGGVPAGLFGLVDGMQEAVRNIAQAGITTVAAAGNSYTPANGNASPAVVPEAVSVVATGPRDGISVYSSGGLGAPDDRTGEPQGKPDVTAIGGSRNDYDMAAYPDHEPYDDVTFGETRNYEGLLGTSMASPSVCGTMGLLTQAMEEAAPDALSLPDPQTLAAADDETSRSKVLQAKSVLLATASETALTARPYHKGHEPSYSHGRRDPYEGYGRVNPDAAVDAVSRNLLANGGSHAETVGLDVPGDSRAVAGYVQVGGGTLAASVEFTGYAGDDADTAHGRPHLDLFVYDPENPQEPGGDPTIVASDKGVAGSASVSVDAAAGDGARTLLVVAKLVNVPGLVNGFDVQANVDLTVDVRNAEGGGSTTAQQSDGSNGRSDGTDDRQDDDLLDAADGL